MSNNNNIDEAVSKQLLNALGKMKEMSRKMEEKQELKRWSEISVPLTMKDALERLTKDELSVIRKHLEISGASQLKKADLIELLCKEIPLSLKRSIGYWDLERYKLIQKIIRKGGFIENPSLEPHQINYLRDAGIVFSGTLNGKKVAVIPEEVLESSFFEENEEQITTICRRNTEWIKLTQGFLYYYGTLNLSEISDLLEKYTNETVRLADYLRVIEDASSYYKQFKMDQSGFSYFSVMDPKKVKQEHQIRKDIPYFPFSKEDLLKAGEPEFNDRNESYLQFVHFLTQNYQISKKEADGIVEECICATQIGEEPNQILQFLQTRLEFPDLDTVQACMEKVVNLMNNTRQWFLKGFTPEELLAQERKSLLPLPDQESKIYDLAAKKKIGRNDPCPCGSGKKYKKCCGK
ncbi:SEC-C metal-binding domain-containing protein [Neobacillus mesonae]|uniref:SEC-C metal-binding domain-containing protein n=1 Tax=Neobacillus mesonae TaxID=1193713 RepID=UPI002E1B5F7C|nr:SEC-C metal-binding domain-containing protein [Neobacillus mesonae]MED4205462.1 SEC-C metal-binding domain-containing protein [Neobacillus mesonae]